MITSPGSPPSPSLEERQAWLATLQANQDAMLGELAQVAGIIPPDQLANEPLARLARVAAFVDTTDFRPATDDARIWLLNRLGLYLARYFIARHGGQLTLQSNPSQRFYLHFVVTGMQPQPDARLDPFAIAHDAINGNPKPGFEMLLGSAEQALADTQGTRDAQP